VPVTGPGHSKQEKGNPKLDSQLNSLVSADTLRESISLAQQSKIDVMTDNRVRVIAECHPEQVNSSISEANKLGIEVDKLDKIVHPHFTIQYNKKTDKVEIITPNKTVVVDDIPTITP